MNGYELAEAMEIRASIRRKATSRKSVTEGANDRLADQLEQAATMLRQQQAEIEALKQSKFDGNNKVNLELTEEKCYEVVFDGENYTTKLVEPKLKTLTDEEILALWAEKNSLNGAQDIVDFARAILRKAQEK